MKVNSFAKLLKQNFQAQIEPKHKTLLDRIDESQKQIAEKFNSTIHPTTLSYLTDSIRINTDNLNSLSNASGQKSKEIIEAEATLYKELRELMSTKEFVEQYENGLKDD
jgi:hypothetical protein